VLYGPGAAIAGAQEAKPSGGAEASPSGPRPSPGPMAREEPAEEPAEECPPRPDDEEQARKLAGEWFAKAEGLYGREQNEKALEAFLCSLELVEHPATLFNAAQAARSAGDYEKAYKLLRRYRDLVPQSDVSDVVSIQIAELEERLARLEKSVEEKEPQAGAGEGEPGEQTAGPLEADEASRPQDAGPSRLTIPGYVAIGVGGALIIGGVVTGAMALSLNGELADECPDGACPASKRDDLDRRDTLAATTNVLIVLGAASATAGVLMLTVFSGEDEEPEVALRPILVPGFGGAVASGRF
jgi:tetratricopeptide (TPR) repeat protein